MCDTILTAIINHLTPNLVGARRRRALPQSCRIPQREPQRLQYLGENMKVLVLLVSFPIRNHVGWGNWRFQISHVPVFFNFRTQQILHNRLLLLALRLLSPNRDTSTKVSQYFSTFCQTLLSFYFPNIVCFFFKKKPRFKKFTLSGLESTSSASVNTPHKGDSFHGNKIVKKKKNHGNICSLLPFLVPLALLCARHGNYTCDKRRCSPLV